MNCARGRSAEQALALPAVRPACAAADSAFVRSCAAAFFSRYGRLLYRRPLSTAELDHFVNLSESAARTTRDTAKGLQAGLSRLLISPHFIFRVERAAPASDTPGQLRLDEYSLATRVSFLLWDAPPDEELLEAARRGELGNRATLAAKVDRMIASPRFDMSGYDQFAGLAKDQVIFPKFNSELARDAQEQTLRTLLGEPQPRILAGLRPVSRQAGKRHRHHRHTAAGDDA